MVTVRKLESDCAVLVIVNYIECIAMPLGYGITGDESSESQVLLWLLHLVN